MLFQVKTFRPSRFGGPVRVLIVDDSNLLRRALERVGSTPAHTELEVVRNGADALVRAGDWQPHLILLDLTAPQSGGLLCLEHLRKVCPPAKVLVVGNASDHRTATQALARGAEAYLGKPFTTAELTGIFWDLRESLSVVPAPARAMSSQPGPPPRPPADSQPEPRTPESSGRPQEFSFGNPPPTR